MTRGVAKSRTGEEAVMGGGGVAFLKRVLGRLCNKKVAFKLYLEEGRV